MRTQEAGGYSARQHPRNRLGLECVAGRVGRGKSIGLRDGGVEPAKECADAEERERTPQGRKAAEHAHQNAAACADHKGRPPSPTPGDHAGGQRASGHPDHKDGNRQRRQSGVRRQHRAYDRAGCKNHRRVRTGERTGRSQHEHIAPCETITRGCRKPQGFGLTHRVFLEVAERPTRERHRSTALVEFRRAGARRHHSNRSDIDPSGFSIGAECRRRVRRYRAKNFVVISARHRNLQKFLGGMHGGSRQRPTSSRGPDPPARRRRDAFAILTQVADETVGHIHRAIGISKQRRGEAEARLRAEIAIEQVRAMSRLEFEGPCSIGLQPQPQAQMRHRQSCRKRRSGRRAVRPSAGRYRLPERFRSP